MTGEEDEEYKKQVPFCDGTEGVWNCYCKRFRNSERFLVGQIQIEVWRNMIYALAPGEAGEKIGLDIGGPGGFFPKQIGIDPYCTLSPWGLKITADETLPFDDASIDYIILTQSLEHMDYPLQCLKECIRVLKTDGLFALHLPEQRFTPRVDLYNLLLTQIDIHFFSVHTFKEKYLSKLDNIKLLMYNSHRNNQNLDILIKKIAGPTDLSLPDDDSIYYYGGETIK